MSAKTIRIKTQSDGRSFGLNGPDFVGNIRKGELRGIIKINEDLCEACDTCRRSARSTPFRAISAPSTRLTISAV